MLGKSSKCEKGKRFCNGEFAIENDSASDIRVLSTCFVSKFNIISFKNEIKVVFNIRNSHRDVILQRLDCLYGDKKPVFCCIRLASAVSLETSSVNSIINNKLIELTEVNEEIEKVSEVSEVIALYVSKTKSSIV